jgi:undecaprenyl-diphosphatase
MNIRKQIPIVILALLFILLVLYVTIYKTSTLDQDITSYFRSIQTPIGITVMRGISLLAAYPFLAAATIIIGYYLYVKKRRQEMKLFIITMASGAATDLILKVIFQRTRPLNPFEINLSFPSGHAVMSLVLFGMIIYMYKDRSKWVYLFALIPLLVGLSRLYLAVHWFTDVIGGFVVGGLILYITVSVLPKKNTT